MRILAIDTSGNTARWIGIENGQNLDPVHETKIKKHDQVLAQGIKDWLAKHHWDKPDALAVVTGPGSYTGLRVGVAFSAAFALAHNIPVINVNAFEMHARRSEPGLCWVLLPMRKNICRGQLIQADNQMKIISDVHEVMVGSTFPPTNKRVLPLGDGYEKYQDIIDEQLGSRRIIELSVNSPEIALADIARDKYLKREFCLPENIDVNYGEEFKPTRKKQ